MTNKAVMDLTMNLRRMSTDLEHVWNHRLKKGDLLFYFNHIEHWRRLDYIWQEATERWESAFEGRKKELEVLKNGI